MNQIRYHYESAFAPYIEGLIRQKKADGFIYDYEAYILKTFDRFCLDNGYINPLITRDIAMKWALQRESEGINYRNQRVSFLRQLSLYEFNGEKQLHSTLHTIGSCYRSTYFKPGRITVII